MINQLMNDSMVLVYFWIFAVSFYLGVIFLSEWVRLRKATGPFIFMTILFFGLSLQVGGTLCMRILMFVNTGMRDEQLMARWWIARSIILAAILTVVAIYFTRRIILRRKGLIGEAE